MWWVGNTSRSKACLCSKLLVHAFKDEITLKVCEADRVHSLKMLLISADSERVNPVFAQQTELLFFFSLIDAVRFGFALLETADFWARRVGARGVVQQKEAHCFLPIHTNKRKLQTCFWKTPGFQLLTRPRVVGGAHTTSEGLEISAGAGLWSGNRFGRSTSLCKRTVWVSLNRCFSSM